MFIIWGGFFPKQVGKHLASTGCLQGKHQTWTAVMNYWRAGLYHLNPKQWRLIDNRLNRTEQFECPVDGVHMSDNSHFECFAYRPHKLYCLMWNIDAIYGEKEEL